MTSQTAFSVFRSSFPATCPKRPPNTQNEMVRMTGADGLREFDTPEPQTALVAGPPTTRSDAPVNRFLWVIGQASAPYALEDCDFGRSLGLQNGMIKHTNLTGGAAAHCGGEVWFLDDDKVVINGCSGRYGPTTERQLREAGLALKALGYTVASMGYDEELNEAPDIVAGEGDLEWL